MCNYVKKDDAEFLNFHNESVKKNRKALYAYYIYNYRAMNAYSVTQST